MHRFFVESDQITEESIIISGEDFKHITKVLRLGKDDVIEVCDGKGTDYRVALNVTGDQTISGLIKERYPSQGENPELAITLFQGLPKGTKMEVIIQKCVELGVVEIVPFASMRAVSQIKDKKDKKIERWQRIAYEAAKQSKRGIIPVVKDPQTLKGLLEKVTDYDLFLLAYEDENKLSLKSVLLDYEKKNQSNNEANIEESIEFSIELNKRIITVGVIIGPEGGFDPQEVEACQAAGIISVSLGKRILRTETAGMVVLSQLNFWK